LTLDAAPDPVNVSMPKKAYTEALPVYRGLGKNQPDVYQLDIARTLSSLGELNGKIYIETGDKKAYLDAKKAYTEALPIYRDLGKNEPDVYQPDIARTLSGLGQLYGKVYIETGDKKAYLDAKKAYTEALPIYRDLGKEYPDNYELSEQAAQVSERLNAINAQAASKGRPR
jgi:nephrocystin-3